MSQKLQFKIWKPPKLFTMKTPPSIIIWSRKTKIFWKKTYPKINNIKWKSKKLKKDIKKQLVLWSNRTTNWRKEPPRIELCWFRLQNRCCLNSSKRWPTFSKNLMRSIAEKRSNLMLQGTRMHKWKRLSINFVICKLKWALNSLERTSSTRIWRKTSRRPLWLKR